MAITKRVIAYQEARAKGLCGGCLKAYSGKQATCEACRVKRRPENKKRQAIYRKLDLLLKRCHSCHQRIPVTGMKQCAYCLERAQVYKERARAKQRLEHLCLACSKPAQEDRTLCAKHLEKARLKAAQRKQRLRGAA